ncbi:MAG: hypothetical protein ACLP8X_20925 [Streptosporangiaceae bacterium]
MVGRSPRKLPELDNLEYFFLFAGLIAAVVFSLAAAIWRFPIAWLLPAIFLALYMILRVLVPLRNAQPILQDFHNQIAALRGQLDVLQISLGATPVEYHIDNNEFYGKLTERIMNSAQHKLDVTYVRRIPPTAFTQEKSQHYFKSILDWANEEHARTVRRIIGVHNEEMRKWAYKHWQDTRQISNYEARILEYEGKLDMLNMALIDERFVYLAFSGSTNQSMSGLSIDDKRACQYFSHYYDQNWANAEPLAQWASRYSSANVSRRPSGSGI